MGRESVRAKAMRKQAESHFDQGRYPEAYQCIQVLDPLALDLELCKKAAEAIHRAQEQVQHGVQSILSADSKSTLRSIARKVAALVAQVTRQDAAMVFIHDDEKNDISILGSYPPAKHRTRAKNFRLDFLLDARHTLVHPFRFLSIPPSQFSDHPFIEDIINRFFLKSRKNHERRGSHFDYLSGALSFHSGDITMNAFGFDATRGEGQSTNDCIRMVFQTAVLEVAEPLWRMHLESSKK